MTAEEETFYRANGYRNLRYVRGVLCGINDFITTRGLLVGISPASMCERRYCYENRDEADAALQAYADTNQHPPGNWVKVKGWWRGKQVNDFNPAWLDLKPWDKVAEP